jgi:LydA holin phage, holin superfamily III
MEPQLPQGLTGFLQALIGGAGTTLVAALVGRLAYLREASRKGRSVLSWALLWELPLIVGMGLLGEAISAWLNLNNHTTTGVVAVLAYLGPRGAEELIGRVWAKQNQKDGGKG